MADPAAANERENSMTEYEDMRQIVVWARIGREIEANVAAAMLSRIDKAEQAGEPCPGYASMLEDLTVSA